MKEYLIFITKINNDTYQLDFSTDVETAWGENWHVAPAATIPDIAPERNAISNSYRIETENLNLNIAARSSCFSMQDCIDGIIALAYTNVEDNYDIVIPFGLEYKKTISLLQEFIKNIVHLKLKDGKEAIEGLIDSLNNE